MFVLKFYDRISFEILIHLSTLIVFVSITDARE